MGCAGVLEHLTALGDALVERQRAADAALRAMDVTFTIYSDAGNIDRPWPFDVIPRVITKQEWQSISAGLIQRLIAINLFLEDIYGDQKIVKDGVVPRALLETASNFRAVCREVQPVHGLWAHICGADLVRDRDGTVYVLEDNLRVPSGVSYMLENRMVTKRVFADLFRDLDIYPVDSYPHRLLGLLASLSPRPGQEPCICVLTPGVYNSAYFEHVILAQEMGAHLVEGQDLVVGDDDCVYMLAVGGPVRVDVIYRRVDDLFLDPEAFRPDSVLGVPGLIRAWRAGKVALANAPGTGIADDKAIYAFMPEIIRYYLSEEPKVANVPTYVCFDPVQRRHVLSNLNELVVKPTNESGGYGIFVGSCASRAEVAHMQARIQADPRNFVAQPILQLSTAPTLCDGKVVPRHLDLRPFVLSGERPYVTQGGLTRVALREGSIVVNSSQGGGSKDTWVVDPTVTRLPRKSHIQSQQQ
jgi:uncharacterized circularly permuted ATP-grasp superfamily protein